MPSIHLRLLRLALNALKKQNHGVFGVRSEGLVLGALFVADDKPRAAGGVSVDEVALLQGLADHVSALLRDRGYMPGTTTRSHGRHHQPPQPKTMQDTLYGLLRTKCARPRPRSACTSRAIDSVCVFQKHIKYLPYTTRIKHHTSWHLFSLTLTLSDALSQTSRFA